MDGSHYKRHHVKTTASCKRRRVTWAGKCYLGR